MHCNIEGNFTSWNSFEFRPGDEVIRFMWCVKLYYFSDEVKTLLDSYNFLSRNCNIVVDSNPSPSKSFLGANGDNSNFNHL